MNLTRGGYVCVSEVANRPLRRMRGLLGRSTLPIGEGLLVTPAPGIHTAFMRFPIDVLFLDRGLRVLDIVERLHPWRVASRRHAHAVLELAAGECARREVRVGDQLSLRDDKPASVADSTVAGPLPGTSEAIIWPSSPGMEDRLLHLQPMRVLVISRDRHFRSVTALLLSHRGCTVTTSANASRVADLITRDHADVVLIDAGPSPARAQTVAAVTALAQPIGIVVVDEAPSSSQESSVLAKWGRFEDLYAALELAGRAPGTAEASG